MHFYSLPLIREVPIEPCASKELREKFLQNFISSRDGPVKYRNERDESMQEEYPTWNSGRKIRTLPYICRCRIVCAL